MYKRQQVAGAIIELVDVDETVTLCHLAGGGCLLYTSIKNYSAAAETLIQLSGGKENFITVENCATRVRIQYKDLSLSLIHI